MTHRQLDIHQHVTDQIIALLDQATPAFELPWHRPTGSAMRPVNVASGRSYRGVNIVTLWATAEMQGFVSGIWGTYQQWRAVSAQVRKGEQATWIVIYKELSTSTDEVDADAPQRQRLLTRAAPVFAAEQVDGWTQAREADERPDHVAPLVRAETVAGASNARIVHGGHRAYYQPTTDCIYLPPRAAFTGTATSTPTQSYYAVLLHELTHWTGHATRCNRQLRNRFGDAAYAMEELIAELGAAFLCADLGIAAAPRPDHAPYLAHWLAVLKADKRAIFTAASKASEAATFLSSLQTKRLIGLDTGNL